MPGKVIELLFSLPDEFPRQRTGKMASPVCPLVFEGMTDIKVRFAGNGDNGSLIER
jgi:hypothetical protein